MACEMGESCNIETHIDVSLMSKAQPLDYPLCHLYLIFFHFQSTSRVAIKSVFFRFCRGTRSGRTSITRITKVSSSLDCLDEDKFSLMFSILFFKGWGRVVLVLYFFAWKCIAISQCIFARSPQKNRGSIVFLTGAKGSSTPNKGFLFHPNNQQKLEIISIARKFLLCSWLFYSNKKAC